jgi:Relaxase/Mobilisation nuclease domain
MLVGFSRHGKGYGGSAIVYLCRGEGREGNEPVILYGDAGLVEASIEHNSNQWKYTSGVLSFAPEDGVIASDIEQELIASFEEVAFAGIDDENRPQGLWVRHSHAGHHEMHFLYPRQLQDGRSYNMRPPGDVKRWDSYRDVWNHRHGWADPEDPKRARSLKLPDYILKLEKAEGKGKEDIREAIQSWAITRISAGMMTNRTELIQQLTQEGFHVSRAGKDYITITAGEQRIRCRGSVFAESFQSVAAITGELTKGASTDRGGREECLRGAEARLEGFNCTRAATNRQRYQQAAQGRGADSALGVDGTLSNDGHHALRVLCRQLELDTLSDGQGVTSATAVGADRASASIREALTEPDGFVSGTGWGRMGEGGRVSGDNDIGGGAGNVCTRLQKEEIRDGEGKDHHVTTGAGERVDAAGAWLSDAVSAIDQLSGGLQDIVRGRYRAINKREQAFTQLIARARAAHQSLTEGYKQFRSVIVPLVQQKLLQRSEQLQLQQQKSKGMDLEL